MSESTEGKKKLRAGLVGLGMMGRHHARVLGSLDGVELVGVCDPMGDPHRVAGTRPLVSQVEELIALELIMQWSLHLPLSTRI